MLNRTTLNWAAPLPAHGNALTGFSSGLPAPSAVERWRSKTSFYEKLWVGDILEVFLQKCCLFSQEVSLFAASELHLLIPKVWYWCPWHKVSRYIFLGHQPDHPLKAACNSEQRLHVAHQAHGPQALAGPCYSCLSTALMLLHQPSPCCGPVSFANKTFTPVLPTSLCFLSWFYLPSMDDVLFNLSNNGNNPLEYWSIINCLPQPPSGASQNLH